MARASKATQPQDRFQVWFWRLVQIVGLLVVCYEVVVEKRERPWIDLLAVAMILGAQGIVMLLRSVRSIQEEADHD